MKHIKSFNTLNESEDRLLGYHITSRRNLKSIMKKGLLPHVPEDYGEDGDVEGIYFFKSIDDTRNALYNWFGERIEEIEEETDRPYNETLLTVDLSGLEPYLIDSVEYEWICTVEVEPSRIIDVMYPVMLPE